MNHMQMSGAGRPLTEDNVKDAGAGWVILDIVAPSLLGIADLPESERVYARERHDDHWVHSLGVRDGHRRGARGRATQYRIPEDRWLAIVVRALHDSPLSHALAFGAIQLYVRLARRNAKQVMEATSL